MTANNQIVLTGNTFKFKDRIRAAGFIWDWTIKGWVGTREQLASCITVSRGMPGVVVTDRVTAILRDMDRNPDSIF
jgi:hypothetical protein